MEDIMVKDVIGRLWWSLPIAIVKSDGRDLNGKELKKHALRYYANGDEHKEDDWINFYYVESYGIIGKRFVIVVKDPDESRLVWLLQQRGYTVTRGDIE